MAKDIDLVSKLKLAAAYQEEECEEKEDIFDDDKITVDMLNTAELLNQAKEAGKIPINKDTIKIQAKQENAKAILDGDKPMPEGGFRRRS